MSIALAPSAGGEEEGPAELDGGAGGGEGTGAGAGGEAVVEAWGATKYMNF